MSAGPWPTYEARPPSTARIGRKVWNRVAAYLKGFQSSHLHLDALFLGRDRHWFFIATDKIAAGAGSPYFKLEGELNSPGADIISEWTSARGSWS